MALPKYGIVEAPGIVASPFGLFCVAKPQVGRGRDGEQWVRGLSQEWETSFQYLNNLDVTGATDYSIVNDGPVTYYDEVQPFFIEVDETRSAMGFLGVDRMARIKRQLEAASQKAVERELWDGDIRIGAGHSNKALVDGATVLGAGAAFSPREALAILEQGIAEMSPAGEPGVIHVTRDVGSVLFADNAIGYSENGAKCLTTVASSPVVLGSGYSGTGPVGEVNRAATTTNKWMYATGTVRVFLGEVDVVNDNLSQAYDVTGNQNDMRLKATRPAAAYFDTSIHLAVRVDPTA